jgi:DNA-binding protein
MAGDIANVNVNEVCLDYIEVPILGKIEAISAQLSKKATVDFKQQVADEEKDMALTADRDGQVISVGQSTSLERLLTLSLIKFSRFDKLKIMAAGRSVGDAVSLALKLSEGEISKETVGIKLTNLYSIQSREDPTRKATAISIYLRKGLRTQYSKRHAELIKRLRGRM